MTTGGGQAGIRGYLVQTLIALLDALDGETSWQSVTLEPNIESDKVDILWKYSNSSKAVQVKSSKNPFRKSDIERWAAELESWRKADAYELVLVGTPGSSSVAKPRKVGAVSVPAPKNLDLDAFKYQAAHCLARLLHKHDLDPGNPDYREMLAEALLGNLATLSTKGQELTHSDLIKLLTDWIPTATESACACAPSSDTARIIRVFVSSPEDVSKERAQLDEICASINRTEGQSRGVRLELFRWERDAVSQIGPGRRQVIGKQIPLYQIYLGIMSTRFGEERTGRYGSGTESEFQEALKRWKKTGAPWITFYFDDQPAVSRKPQEVVQYLKVCEFREKLETMGLVGVYKGVRGTQDGFYEKVSEHLRMIVARLPHIEAKPVKKRRKSGPDETGGAQPGKKIDCDPIVPPEYIEWLIGNCGEMDLMGLQIKKGAGVLLNQVYTPLITSTQLEAQAGSAPESIEEPADERLGKHGEGPRLLLPLLDKESLYVSGDPGSGKSTFCRWVNWLMCKGAVPPEDDDLMPSEPYREIFPEKLRGKLPVSVRLRDFWMHLPPNDGRFVGFGGLEQALEKWLLELNPPGLDWACLKAHLHRGSAMLMLDGVDEVPTMHKSAYREWYPREKLLGVLAEALKRWTGAGNRVMITSRPYGLDGHQQEKLGLVNAPIQGMDGELQALLVRRWFVRLKESRASGLDEAAAMIGHLNREKALNDLAANPLLLTAMCIIYDEGKRLPEDKYVLYDRIVDTVLCRRYPQVQERVSAIRGRLGAIAFGMHTGDGLGQEREGPEASASDREVDMLLEKYQQLDGSTDKGLTDTVHAREDLLSQSGLLVSRGDDRAEFYHLSFQEFLAAERLFILLGRDREGLTDLVLQRGASANWRNTLSFLFGCVVSKFNPSAGVDLLKDVVGRLELPPVDPARRGQGGSAWSQAIVLGVCLEILVGRGAVVPEDLGGLFEKAVERAIEQEIAVKDRHTLAVALGRLGDSRIAEDLRVQGNFDDHPGYVRVPAGPYFFGDDKKPFMIDEPFRLSRYPVTNSQYALFMKEGGYEKAELWSEEGRLWLETEGIRQPEYWRDPRFSGPNQPVVGVSFFEAEAFAGWVGGSLPSERQWEAAARGPEGHAYPWGDEWEDGICNSYEARLRSTSTVGIFPRSRSNLDLDDMAGNVFEWCADYEDKEASYRVFRGGSWSGGAWVCRASSRNWGDPADRRISLGFRVALVPPGGQLQARKN